MTIRYAIAFATTILLAGSAVGAFAATPTAGHYAGEKLAIKADITIAQAADIALKAHPGKIVDRELEIFVRYKE